MTWIKSAIALEHFSMERRYRLTCSKRFQQVCRQGQAWSHPLLVLLALNNDLSYSRFGFLVSKRIGQAVQRNRVKRLMREAVRARLTRVSPGWDIVLIARSSIARANLWHIGEALDFLLRRANLVTESLDAPK